jgi:hypothetical protein
MTKRTVYTIHNNDGTYLELFLDGDTLTIRSLWANDELRGEIEFEPTVGMMADLHTAIDEIETAVIGE